jgi:ABC-type multidrug transport system fused ATPase/permease subunit
LIATLLARAALNFFGIAALVPLLVLILDGESLRSHPTLDRIYESLGFGDYRIFAIATAAAAVAAIVLKGAINMSLYRVERDYVYDIYRDLSRRLYISYCRRGLAFVRRSNSTELSRNVNFVCLNFATGVLRPLATIVGETFLLLLVAGATLAYDPVAALLLAGAFIPAAALYYRLVKRRMSDCGRTENEAMREKFRSVAESFGGYADAEICNAFPRMLADFDRSTERLIGMRKRNAAMAALPQSATETAVTVGLAALVVAGAYMRGGEIRIVFGLFALAAVRLAPSVRNILGALATIRYNRHTIDVLSEASDVGDLERNDERLPLRRDLSLRGITFGYDDATPVLKDFSLRIRRGERVGIKGPSGAGKSTLLNIMAGLLEPQGGEMLVDGARLDDSNRRAWQNSAGYVPQNVFIADATLAENVAFGENLPDAERVAESLEAAGLAEFARNLPEGIDALVGESGCRVSGGERQRIGIARALYRRPDILFLDEATSALDRESERNIHDTLARLSGRDKELTIVAIAHDEASLGYCDRIIEIGKEHV